MAHARDNNFDLIRLLAAAQVFIMHSIAWLQVPVSHLFLEVMDWFPGVPVFFMISGYLVTASFVRSPSTIEYLRNRALRIFPGLWVCLVLTYVLVLLRGGLAESNLLSKTVVWFIANATLFQFAGAAGTGVANGALWSISTELQFYLLMPIAVLLVAKSALSRLMTSLLIMFGIVLSGAFHDLVLSAEARLHPWVYATLYASVLTNGFLFLLGVLAYLWRERLLPLVSNKALFFLTFYVALRSALAAMGVSANTVHSSMLAILVYPFLMLAVFSFAYSFIGLAGKLFGGNDFSYGIYLYHMPLIYTLRHYDLHGAAGFLYSGLALGVIAVASWFLVERPMLKLKHYSVAWNFPVASSR